MFMFRRQGTASSLSRWERIWPGQGRTSSLRWRSWRRIFSLSSTVAEGIIGVFAWSACDRELRRRFVAIKTKEATLIARVREYAMMRAMQDEEYEVLHEITEYMNERHENWVSKLQSGEVTSPCPR